MNEQLTALDATFLELEQIDPSAHMHIGAIMVFDPRPDGSTPTETDVCRLLDERLGALPRYSQRLSRARTGGLSWPDWETDPAYDVRRHVGRAALPAPGGDDELAHWASGFFSQRLDRRRPLWEMVLVEGLAGGRWGLASKTHHCMVDGVGSVDVGHVLLDPEPASADRTGAKRGRSAQARRPSRSAPDPSNGAARGTGGGLSRLARLWPALVPVEPLREAAEAGIRSARHPRETLHKARGALGVIVDEELHPAPHTSLNEPIGTLRRLEVVRVPLQELRAIKEALGGTINDVVLALTTGGLRELLVSREEALPETGLRVMVPMNVRSAGERLALGNKISSLFVDLPIGECEQHRRYTQIVEKSRGLKDEGQAAATAAVLELTALAPPFLHSALAQALYATKLFNVTVTNVPGPQVPLYALGGRLREVQPLVPLAAEHGLGIAVLSYDGTAFFGIVADPDAVPDLDVLIDGLESTKSDLLALAAATRGRGANGRTGTPGQRSRRRGPSPARPSPSTGKPAAKSSRSAAKSTAKPSRSAAKPSSAKSSRSAAKPSSVKSSRVAAKSSAKSSRSSARSSRPAGS